MREIEWEKVEKIKDTLKFTDWQMAELLGLHVQKAKDGTIKGSGQYYNYRKSGAVPANRYFGVQQALLQSVEDELRERRQQIIALFN